MEVISIITLDFVKYFTENSNWFANGLKMDIYACMISVSDGGGGRSSAGIVPGPFCRPYASATRSVHIIKLKQDTKTGETFNITSNSNPSRLLAAKFPRATPVYKHGIKTAERAHPSE